eukprot:5498629-Amphidinium_carterae.1
MRYTGECALRGYSGTKYCTSDLATIATPSKVPRCCGNNDSLNCRPCSRENLKVALRIIGPLLAPLLAEHYSDTVSCPTPIAVPKWFWYSKSTRRG